MSDPSSSQLEKFKESVRTPAVLQMGHGAPVADKLNSLTAGARGPQLIQDTVYIDEMAHFDRERIPERVVHAKGAGAFGYFECSSSELAKYTDLAPFQAIGKKTPLAARFSTVGGESGSSDTVRDPRGFAIKFYTETGNWDLVGNNTPIFFIRDPLLFPSFIHTQKRNPQTHLKDANMFWDFISLRPETTHQVMFLFSDRGIPDGYRHMNGYGSHTFKLVKSGALEPVYCKFHWKTNQGIKCLQPEQADRIASSDPDYGIRDLYNAIETGNFPSWTLKVQIMTFQQASQFPFNPFDLTKVWPQKDFPLITVGRMVLNRNPQNYFAEVEQLAFAPSHMIPGIEPSPDKMLQGRLFSYPDTHRHRLGANYLMLPVNCPYAVGNNSGANTPHNYQRDGPMCATDNQGGAPNYFPNSFAGPAECKRKGYLEQTCASSGDVARYNSSDDDNFTQPGIFYRKVLNEQERARLIDNIASHLKNSLGFIQRRAVDNFSKVDPNLGRALEKQISTVSKL